MKKTATLRDHKFGFKIEITVSGKEEQEGDLDIVLNGAIEGIIEDRYNFVTREKVIQ
jgi:hypothetical protein